MKKIIKFLDNYGYWFALISMLILGVGMGLFHAKNCVDAPGIGFIYGLKSFGKLTLIILILSIATGLIFRCWGFFFIGPTYLIYFLSFLIYLFILSYNYGGEHDLFASIIVIIVSLFTVTGLPMFIAFFLCSIIYNWDIETSDNSDIKMSDNKKKDIKIRTTHFVDKKGNAAGTATTYDYGNHSETYIKDNFGNVEVESKSYDNYRETKFK
mgnify:CR=1 FL=1